MERLNTYLGAASSVVNILEGQRQSELQEIMFFRTRIASLFADFHPEYLSHILKS
jgi:hypothetical protein